MGSGGEYPMNEEDWLILSKVKRSTYRRQILAYLHEVDEPRTPSEIASRIEISRNHVSRALNEMREEDDANLVTVLNPDAPYDRLYKITDRGRKIVEKIREIEDET